MRNDLPELIGELEEWKARIPLAASRAVNPKRWREKARTRAGEILDVLARTDEERAYAAQLVAAVTVAYWDFGIGMVWRMDAPAPGFDVNQVRVDETSGDLFQRVNRGQVNRLYDWVLRWVQTPEAEGGKHRDARDKGKSDGQIAWVVVTALLNPEMRGGLLKHIQPFIDSHAQEAIGETKLKEWMLVIASAWVDLILEEVPEMVANEVVKEFREAVARSEH